MRLATAVGQTHGCYFLNNLSFYGSFDFYPAPYQFQFVGESYFRHKNRKYFGKKSLFLKLMHIFASEMYNYSK
jgi:hypothetical protein